MTLSLETDVAHLSRAIALAERGRGRVSPNPLVGAVVARAGKVLGEGFHAAYGEAHAERAALAACSEDPRGATLYVSLEPCCHHGQTPPCTDAIIEAGISRVVVASDDPTEKASGRGLGILRDEGIEVDVADGEPAFRARLLNQPFRKHARTGRPHVLFKSAMTLDGKVATRTGDSKWISGEASRRLSHHWRAECDAVVVGRAASRLQTDALEAAGADVILATGENEPARVRSALTQLGAADITSILLEGGPKLAGAFLDAGELDELRLFLAPVVLGGKTARDPLEGEGVETIAEAVHALTLECESVGADLLVSARLKEW